MRSMPMQAVVQFVNRGFSERAAKMIDYLSRYNYGLHSYGLQSYGLCTYGSKYDGLSRLSFPLTFLIFELSMFVHPWIGTINARRHH